MSGYDGGYKKSWFETTPMQDWLYGEWDEDKLRTYEFLSNVPVLGNYMNYLLDLRRDHEYMTRYGLTFKDVSDPRKLHQTSSGIALYGSSINFISHNVSKLYQ